MEDFLANCLGGRVQPIGDDFDGSSVQILHGAEYVSGLEQTDAVVTGAEETSGD